MRIGWNTGGGRVCCGTCHRCCVSPGTAVALVGWPTLFSYSPWTSPSSPSCVSSRKNFWTASASLKSGGSESPALSLAGFYFFFFVLSACSWSWGHSGAPHPRAAMALSWPPSPSSLHRGADLCSGGPAKKPFTTRPRILVCTSVPTPARRDVPLRFIFESCLLRSNLYQYILLTFS